jgi:hypothetical protein
MNISDPQDPDRYEQTCLNGVNEIYRLLGSRMNSYRTKSWHSLQEIAALISELNEQWLRLHAYSAGAIYLKNSGRLKLGERLRAILADLATTIQTCNKMYQHTSKSMQGIAEIGYQANAGWARAIQESNAKRQAAFDDYNRQWSDNFKNS